MGAIVGSSLAYNWEWLPEPELWPMRVTRTLAIQWLILAVASVVWICISGDPSQREQFFFLMASACAMGIQGSAVRMIGFKVSTTYMTGALTTLLEAVVTRRRFSYTESSAVGGILALATGAVFGSMALKYFPAFAFMVPTAALGLALVVRLRFHFMSAR